MTVREIAALFEDLELRLIESLKRNLARHKAWEQDEGFSWAAWQAEKLRHLWRFRRENAAILGEYEEKIDSETRAMLKEQFAESADPDNPNHAFFGVNGKKLDALINEMTNNEYRVERASLRYMDDIYRKTILRAATAFNAGGVTMQQATDMATKDFLEQGINCIEYRDGRMVNIATYAEMALRTCNTRAMLLGEAQRREELGIDTVLVSQYGGCSETCLPWQGLVYIDDVWQPYHGASNLAIGGSYGQSRNGHSYLMLSVAVKAGLFHPNCRHHLTTWIEGVSERPKPMDKAEVERISKLEKKQRALERRVRKYKRLAVGTLDPKKAKEYRAKVRDAQKAVREFVAQHGDVLRRDYWRERDDGAHTVNTVLTAPASLETSPETDASGQPFNMQQTWEKYRDYINGLTNLPDYIKMYLDYYINKNPAVYEYNPNISSAFAYDFGEDKLLYNPASPVLQVIDTNQALTHEMGHRIDRNALHSDTDLSFIAAIKDATNKVLANPTKYKALVRNINDMFFEDTISILGRGKLTELRYGHKESDLKKPGSVERELFANFFMFEVSSEREIIACIKQEFPDVWEAYQKVILSF